MLYIFYRTVPIIALFILLILVLFFTLYDNSKYLLAQQVATSVPENKTASLKNVTDFHNKPVVSVNTDKPKYVPGQFIRVIGNVSDENGMTTDTNVQLETRKTHDSIGQFLWPFNFNYVETKNKNNTSILHRAFLLTKNGTYSDLIMNLGSGKYNVTANASLNGDILTDWTTFEVIDWNTSIIFLMLIVTLAFFWVL